MFFICFFTGSRILSIRNNMLSNIKKVLDVILLARFHSIQYEMNKVLNRIHKMESKFQPKTKKVSCSDFNKRGDQYYASRYGLSLLFGSWTLFNCCIIITAVLFQLDQNGGWNICFLTFVFNFQDSVDFQIIVIERKFQVGVREKSAKKEGVGDKKISKILTFLT